MHSTLTRASRASSHILRQPWPATLGLCLAACSGAQKTSGSGTGGGDAFGNATGASGNSAGAGQTGQNSVVAFGNECAALSQTAANRLQPADIIIAIDNSQSMTEETLFVREQMNAFSQQIVDSGVDVHIVIISATYTVDAVTMASTTGGGGGGSGNGICIDPPLGSGSCPEDSSLPRFLHVPNEVGSNDSLNLFISTYPQWQAQLRPNATKTFAVVTDDDATDGPNNSAAAFIASVAGLDPALFAQWQFSGIYCFTQCPQAAAIGTVYRDLITQKQGVAGDLCLQDFAPVFDALAQSVIGASGLDCEWEIPPAPQGESFTIGRVNVQYTITGSAAPQQIFHVPTAMNCSGQGGWFYDDNANPSRVIVCPETCTALKDDPSAKIDILFGCQTVEGPI